jgi:hypothetical protein
LNIESLGSIPRTVLGKVFLNRNQPASEKIVFSTFGAADLFNHVFLEDGPELKV